MKQQMYPSFSSEKRQLIDDITGLQASHQWGKKKQQKNKNKASFCITARQMLRSQVLPNSKTIDQFTHAVA